MSFDNDPLKEVFFKQTFQYAPIGMAVLSTKGKFLRANPALCLLLGYPESELKLKTFGDITHPKDLPDNVGHVQPLLDGRLEVYETEKRYLHKSGRELWTRLVVSLVRNEEGAPLHFVAQIVDLTEQKQAKQQLDQKNRILQQKELLYQSIADNSFDFITRHDLDGTYLEVSVSCYEMLGYSKEEMIGEPGYTFLHPDEKAYILECHLALLQTGKRSVLTYRLRRKDGRYLWVESTMLGVPEADSGHLKEVVIVSRDINDRVESYNRLKEAHKRYQVIANNAKEIISFTDPLGVVQYISPAVTQLLGYAAKEVVGTRLMDYWDPAERQTWQSRGPDASWFNGMPYSRLLHKDGRYIHVETTFQPVRNASGDIVQILCISRDITERKKAEDELRMTKEKLESFISNHADAVWIMDREGYVQQVNAAFQKLFQWGPIDLLSSRLPVIREDDLREMEELTAKVLSGSSVVGHESVWRRKDGSLVEVSTTVFPIRDSSGSITGIAGTTQDIQEKKRSEKRLKASKEQFKAYLEQNIDPVLILDTDYRVIRVNPAFEDTFGWSTSEIVGTIVFELPSVPAGKQYKLNSTFEKMKPHSIETVRKKKDGAVIPVLLSLFPLLDEAGTHNGWALNLRDMTAYKQAEQLLINSEKLSVAGQLAAGIAHEIRNPITAIKGFVQLINSGISDKQLYYDIMSSEIERIEMILSELLVLAKPQVVHFEKADIRQLLNQVITLLDSQANMDNVQISTEYEPGAAWILCDPNQFKQVCINFIKNAIEAMPDGGKVLIQLGKTVDGQFRVRFTDNGSGIPEDVLAKLGQPFYTTKEKGTGLGYMVSKKIIENHNGTVIVYSKEGEGTTIEVTLPAMPQQLEELLS